LLVLPVLTTVGRVQATYVPINSRTDHTLSPVAKDLSREAERQFGSDSSGFDPLSGSTGGKEEVNPPDSRPTLPALLWQAARFTTPRGGGMTSAGNGTGSGGTGGAQAGLASPPRVAGHEPWTWFRPNDPAFVPSPMSGGLFRPPRVAEASS
jgi:hypothetical protein